MICSGYANRTPWNCPRDVDEVSLEQIIETMVRKVANPSTSIFNLHCPPYGTSLDLAKKLDQELVPQMSIGSEEVHVGSSAVRKAIEKYQPCVGLHGHIHEQHAFDRIGRTLCFNPGSDYQRGLLQGVYLEFNHGHLKRYGLTREDR